jgi:Dolichyl-phosphate-mannose-protein mannosyltransferase
LPSIQIGDDQFPPMYPVGYPVLMLPWLKILPEADSILAPFRTNQTVGFLLLFGVFGFYLYLAKPLTGGFAALLLATLPGFFTFCRSSTSEISASAFVVLAFMFAYLGLKEERRWKIYLSAVFLGLSLNIRIQSLFFAPLLLAIALFPVRAMRSRWFLHCVAVPVVFVLAASPLLVLNTIQFHSPFKTGYTFWISPIWLAKNPPFSLRYIPDNTALLWRELTLHPKLFSPARYFGTGTSFVAPFVLLVCVGVFFIRLNRFVICAFLAGLSFFALTTSLVPKWVDVRYYLPLLILLVAVAVLPVIWAAENLFVARRAVASLAIFALFAAACLGYPSHSDDRSLKANRLQSLEALHFKTRLRQSAEFIAQRRFIESVGQERGIVFSDISPVYLNALFPSGLVAAPLDGKRYIGFRNVVHYDRAQAVALAELSLHRSIPVYALFVSQKELEEKAVRLPQVDGYEWVVAENLPAKPVILKLTPK